MVRGAIFAIAVLLAASAVLRRQESRPARAAPFQKGICYAYTLGRGLGYDSARSADSLKRLQGLGVEWVSLTPFAWYRRLDDPSLELIGDRGRGAERDETIRKAAQDAHRARLRVLLKPHLWGHAGWAGDLEMKSERDWEAFHANYRRVAMHYAALASVISADAYCIGVELRRSTLSHPSFWRALIEEIRTSYPGPLVYGANWEGEFAEIEFWDALDWIGVQAYFPIADSPGADPERLRRGASRAADRIGAVAARFRRPVVLTEIGFRSVIDAGLRPWDDSESERVRADDDGTQARCFEAVFGAFWGRSWFRGLYLWKWESGGLSPSGDYHFQDRPAERVVAEWFRKPAPR